MSCNWSFINPKIFYRNFEILKKFQHLTYFFKDKTIIRDTRVYESSWNILSKVFYTNVYHVIIDILIVYLPSYISIFQAGLSFVYK